MREKCPELFCTPYLSVFNPNPRMRTRITPNTGAFHAVNVIWCYLYVDLIFLKFEDNDKCTMDMKCTIKLWKKPQKIWLLNKSNLIFLVWYLSPTVIILIWWSWNVGTLKSVKICKIQLIHSKNQNFLKYLQKHHALSKILQLVSAVM